MSPAEDEEEEEAAEAVDMIPCGARGARGGCLPDTPGEAAPTRLRTGFQPGATAIRGVDRGSGQSRVPAPAPLRFPPPGPAH